MASDAQDQPTGAKGELISNQQSTLPLEELVAQATAKYAEKEYSEAADLYSRATELQAQTNGDLSPLNADLLFCYGRCLYHVALQNSDILGSKISQGAKLDEASSHGQSKARASRGAPQTSSQSTAQPEQANDRAEGGPSNFQFIGDEDYGASEDEEDEDGPGAEASEEEDEFSNAFEILDLARVLFLRRLEDAAAKDEHSDEDAETRRLKERLADTYDLQAEVSLEGERFSDAAKDLKAALDLKSSFYPAHSNLVAETHYKLSLALEFASVSSLQGETEDPGRPESAKVDEAMRKEAGEHMKAAIKSCELRILREEETLTQVALGTDGVDGVTSLRRSIDDVKDMVQDMQQRLLELQQPFTMPSKDQLEGGAVDSAALRGIFATMLDKSPEARKEQLDQAAEDAKDLTSLVKRKKPVAQDGGGTRHEGSAGKRKADAGSTPPRGNAAKRTRADDGGEGPQP